MGESPRSTDCADALSLSQLGQDDRASSEVALALKTLQLNAKVTFASAINAKDLQEGLPGIG
jgi:hypothetical protein